MTAPGDVAGYPGFKSQEKRIQQQHTSNQDDLGVVDFSQFSDPAKCNRGPQQVADDDEQARLWAMECFGLHDRLPSEVGTRWLLADEQIVANRGR
jgi:hypothetical protein